MDPVGEIQKVASMRRGDSGSIWRRGEDVFSRSSREEDDEEALRWAALEKLPTYDRVRRAIVPLGAEAGAGGGKGVGIDMPTIEVRFENLEAEAEVRVGSSGLPTILNSVVNTVEEAATALHLLPSRKQTMPVLHDISGIIKPRRLTLLLGPPGSGKTTFLLALAGRLDKDLKASAMSGEEANVVTDYILKILGLEICADTMVGNEMIRGISGGQRKRVTTGEMLVGPAGALFMDEISTGLDSSTTFQIVTSLRQSIHILGGTAVISLLQPAPETYNLFDDIILLSDGQVVYQGPREEVLEFFESMGFRCPERKGVADFLQEVTSKKDQKQYWARHDEPYRFVPVKEFATAFKSFHTGRAISNELAVPFDKSKSHPAALTTTRFFKNYLLLLAINQMSASAFRFIGGAARNMIVANVFASFMLLVFMALGGFILVRVNEMLGHSWDKIVNSTASNETLGVQALASRGVFTEAKWYWIGFGAMIVYILLFNALFTLALTYLKPFGSSRSSVSEDDLNERHASMEGKVLGGNHLVSANSHRSTGIDTETGSAVVEDDSAPAKRGMILPFTPLSLTFDNIRYSVDMPQEMKAQGVQEDRLELLKGVSGSFRPGVLTALMGVSGAGKTTLMDVLAGRKTGGYIEGDISISGYPKKQETFARISGYCEQNDIHSPQLTVYESLLFSAWLRLPKDVDSNKRKIFIEEVMELVELKPLRDSLVGLPGVNGLSTEQRKRLTIAVELVANPSIIFMDEPTSGLDARAAAIVMRTVRNTVNTGRTVVCTIHQPSIDIFEAFDELFLMKRGGEEIYAGPLGHHSSELIKYFEGIQGVSKIEDGYNPATWMLEVTTVSQEQKIGVDFSDMYKKSELYQRNKALIKELSQPAPDSSDLYFPTKYSRSSITQCMACLWKQNLSYWRNPPYNTVRKTSQDLINAMGSMYAAVLFIGIMNCTSVQPVVAVERTVFYRERAAGMYSAFPYAFGQIVIELPYALAQDILYGVIVYSMIGFEWTAAKFFWYLFFAYFTLLYFTFYGMMAVGITPNSNIATVVSAAFYVPIWWRWYCWACPMAWTLYGLVASQFGDITTLMDDIPGMTVKAYIEDRFDFKHSWLGGVAAAVVGFTVLFAGLFGFAIMKLNFQKR
ncbi:hypothetical protein HU200_036503 [Digitaria exilis]|uniref:ABC transporter domain-containing protein n=1 Tax=Digitaria exilis TaxID=1010633 RepID=A0A835BGC7_9POAL|nr:hypothetical protein HU200_036503 [Digitaria exilis]